MSAKSNYLSDKLLDSVLKDTAYSSPTTVYLALFNGNPNSGGTEASGGSYARQSCTFGSASSGSSATTADITFSSMPATTVDYVGIYDASTAGNLLYFGSVTSITTNSGDTVKCLTGNLTVSES